MKANISGILIIQMTILLISSLIMYFLPVYSVNFFSLKLALLFAILNFGYFIYIRNRYGLRSKSISITLFFVISCYIVSFQFPVDLVLASHSNNSLYNVLIYDELVLVKSVWFALCFMILVCLGMHVQAIKMNKNKNVISNRILSRSTEQPFFYLFYLFFILHILTVDPTYYLGNSSASLSPIAGSILGYFILLLPICFGTVIYNFKISKPSHNINFFQYIRLFPFPFTLIILLFSILTFLAGDRGPAIRAILLTVSSFYIISNKNISYVKFLSFIIVAGFFLSTIKLIGAISFDQDLIQSFLDAHERLSDSSRNESFSPYTAELSESFRAYNTSFSLWYNGASLNGISILTGILMSFPYAVSLLMQSFNLDVASIDTASFLTEHVNEVYGIGTTIIGDSLLNIGFVFTLLLAFIVGMIFYKFDYHLFHSPSSIYFYIIGLYLLMNAIVFPRASIFPAIGNIIFLVIVVFSINSIVKFFYRT